MAKIEKQLPKSEVDILVRQWLDRRKTTSKIDRGLTYKLYNQFFNKNQRDVNACSCMDKDTDFKVTRHIETTYQLDDPLPIQSDVKIDLSSFVSKEKKSKISSTTKPKKPRKKRTTKPKTTTKKDI